MRLAIPNLDQSEQIHQAGLGVINLFGSDFFDFLNTELSLTDGVDWLTQYRKTSLVYANYNFIDPSNLLKELLRVSTSPLRKPIRERIPQNDIVVFFNRLQAVLEDRNDWVHHNSTFSREKLKTLLLNVYPIADRMKLTVINECDFLLSTLDGVEPDVPQTEEPITASTDSKTESALTKEFKDVISENEMPIGGALDIHFLDYSYVLHLTGEIRNRKTNELLSELNAQASEKIGALLITRKPSGGRLKISSQGLIAAYFEDHWGYLGKVSPEQWFPDHLHLGV
jgi:hypothetical protein